VSNQYYSKCSGTGLPNFSYATGVYVVTGANFVCTSTASSTYSPPFTVEISWFYYNTYPPPACGAADLPNGDQCCHTTATSTLSFYRLDYLLTPLATYAVSTGNVTAGAFLGKSAKWTLLDPIVASLNFNCLSNIGQETWTGLTSLQIGNILTGVTCDNGVQFSQACPGWH